MSENSSTTSKGPSELKVPATATKASGRGGVDDSLLEVFGWIDSLPIGRSKAVQMGRLHREFADGRVVAEILASQFPKLVDVHNYPVACSINAKRINWETMRRKVLEKLEINLTDDEIEMIIKSRVGGIEGVLKNIYDVTLAIQQSKVEAKERKLAEIKAEAEAEEALETAKVHGPWTPYTSCYGRINTDGREDIVVCGKLMVEKDKYDSLVATNKEIIAEKDGIIKQLRSQVSRLQMTVGLKEDHLVDLTKEVCKLRGDYHAQGEGGDADADLLRSLESLTYGAQGDQQHGASAENSEKDM